jgi:selenocysteine lyase/cysteine desulfurase
MPPGGRVDDRHRQPDGGHHLEKRRGALRRHAEYRRDYRAGRGAGYVSALGLTHIAEYEQTLMRYALQALESVPDLTLTARQRLG